MSDTVTPTDLRRLNRHVRGLWLAVLALGALVAAVNRDALAEFVPASMAGPSFAGTWEGEFKMTAVEIGGIFTVKPHLVSVSLTLTEREGVIEGVGEAENILGDLAMLAFVKGPQRGTVTESSRRRRARSRSTSRRSARPRRPRTSWCAAPSPRNASKGRAR